MQFTFVCQISEKNNKTKNDGTKVSSPMQNVLFCVNNFYFFFLLWIFFSIFFVCVHILQQIILSDLIFSFHFIVFSCVDVEIYCIKNFSSFACFQLHHSLSEKKKTIISRKVENIFFSVFSFILNFQSDLIWPFFPYLLTIGHHSFYFLSLMIVDDRLTFELWLSFFFLPLLLLLPLMLLLELWFCWWEHESCLLQSVLRDKNGPIIHTKWNKVDRISVFGVGFSLLSFLWDFLFNNFTWQGTNRINMVRIFISFRVFVCFLRCRKKCESVTRSVVNIICKEVDTLWQSGWHWRMKFTFYGLIICRFCLFYSREKKNGFNYVVTIKSTMTLNRWQLFTWCKQ